MKEIEKDEILRVLLSNSWNVTEAAKRLGYGSKQTLYNKMREYEIKRPTGND
jgi:transcriptional regulator of acetoin/glycerol metabolism